VLLLLHYGVVQFVGEIVELKVVPVGDVFVERYLEEPK
jgi:hypothetical protein